MTNIKEKKMESNIRKLRKIFVLKKIREATKDRIIDLFKVYMHNLRFTQFQRCFNDLKTEADRKW